MFNNDDFVKWTNEIIAHDLEKGELKNILQICEQNFDLWTKELFPVLQQQRKSCYRVVVSILQKGGCLNANEDMVRSYFSYIRKKRGLVKRIAQKVPVPPSLTQTRSGEVVPTPVVVSPIAAPVMEVQAPSHQVARPVAKPVTQVDQAEYPHVYAKASTTLPTDYEDMRDEIERWKSEASVGWVAEWTGVDEFVWLDFLDRIEEFNKYNSPKWTVMGNHVKFKNEIGQQQLKEAFDLLKKKVVKQRRARA